MHNQVPPDPFPQPAPPAAGPYPYPPQPYGPPPGYPPPPPRTNGFAIGALIISICGGLGIGTALGYVFGFLALSQIKRQPQKGRGMAIAAIVIASLHLVALAGALIYGVADEARDRKAGIQDTDVTALKTGDCVREFDVSSTIYDLPVVACTAPHSAEIYHTFTFPDGEYPGAAAVEAESSDKCVSAFDPYDSAANENIEIYYMYPQNAIEWRRDRTVLCIADDPAGNRTTPLSK
ncbi:DUF4190 domain-containing protein [Actinoplanes sp. G11-F43]|uniref:DUF4190 domain-containing protein n=1 Tax=Actinoplanes sp. G11-F43 TaxID=3424130 RepID=UPI003D3517D7